MPSNEDLDRIYDRLRAIEGKDKQDHTVTEIFRKLRSHERRIGSLEKWRWKIAGAIGAMSALFGALIQLKGK